MTSTRSPDDDNGQSEILLCKFCGQPERGLEGIAKHLKEQAGQEPHPEKPNPRLSGIKPPQNKQFFKRIGVSDSFEEDAENPVAEFRREYEYAAVDDELKFVSVAELESLYDEFCEHQDSSGWISATRRLREFIDQHK